MQNKLDEFLQMYKTGSIVYPDAVARNLHITLTDAYKLCEERKGKDLKVSFVLKCPVCNCRANQKTYDSLSEVGANYPDDVMCCENCGYESAAEILTNVRVIYRKV